jgi:hypothetical protein
MIHKEVELNLGESTIKKKRGQSFFNAERQRELQVQDSLQNPQFIRGNTGVAGRL